MPDATSHEVAELEMTVISRAGAGTANADASRAVVVVITPIRDEEAHLPATLESMVRQALRPAEWLIVDDGSRDTSADIVRRYAAQHPWIRLVQRADRGFRKSGTGVMEAFHAGLAQLKIRHWDYLIKLDGDLCFATDYLERCIHEFAMDPTLGIGGGIVCDLQDGIRIPERAPRFHVRGATKIYRKQCWEEIGGLIRSTGWDTFDEIKANSLGWTTRSFEELMVVHQRATGTADGNLRSAVKYGVANHICGYHPLFMLCKCLKRAVKDRTPLRSGAMMWGFLSAKLKGMRAAQDKPAIAYLRAQQIRALLGRESLWR